MSALIHFTKMQSLGNDFVVINALSPTSALTPDNIRLISHRQLGIGCDQVLLIAPSLEKDCDFYYRIFNADGSEAGQCGNGARCFAQYIHEKKLSPKKNLRVHTRTTVLTIEIQEDKHICVNMGVPRDIRSVLFQNIPGIMLDIGNPHVVFTVPSIGDNNNPVNIKSIGQSCNHNSALFPEGVNVGFMQILNKNQIRLRVYERAVGETYACGSGACAAVIAGVYQKLLDNTVEVILPYGTLTIHWSGLDSPVFMTGDAVTVFEGTIAL